MIQLIFHPVKTPQAHWPKRACCWMMLVVPLPSRLRERFRVLGAPFWPWLPVVACGAPVSCAWAVGAAVAWTRLGDVLLDGSSIRPGHPALAWSLSFSYSALAALQGVLLVRRPACLLAPGHCPSCWTSASAWYTMCLTNCCCSYFVPDYQFSFQVFKNSTTVKC